MIAEESISNNEKPDISLPKTKVVLLIIESMKQSVPYFKSYIAAKHHNKASLSEDDLTQIFIEQAQIIIRKEDYPFNLSSQYRDIYNLSRGYSDFYFYPNELDISTTSLFSVESKRLPSTEASREKEYVIGTSKNGGIERYKIEKHGKGLADCGLIGFIEKENPNYWKKTINNWIKDLASKDKTWNDDEILHEAQSETEYVLLNSIAHRKSNYIRLLHLWISV